MRIQPSLSDRFFISWKHNVLFSISLSIPESVKSLSNTENAKTSIQIMSNLDPTQITPSNANKMAILTKATSLQYLPTETIRPQMQPSKHKWEITKIANSQNTKRTFGQPNEQLFSQRWPLSNSNGTKNNMNTHRVL